MDRTSNLLSYIQSSNVVDLGCNCNSLELQQAQEWKNHIDKLQVSWQPSIYNYLSSFKGYCWRLCDIWFSIVPRTDTIPIKYLEIGTLCGANLISVAKTYGSHPNSELYCIDPWIDNEEYNEYKCLQASNMNNFISNINEAGIVNKIKAYRDFSYRIIPEFNENYFDIIYIDGNHEPYAVMEDGVLAFRKCKKGGWIIFDDYTFTEDVTNTINAFLSLYKDKISYYTMLNGQCYVQKN